MIIETMEQLGKCMEDGVELEYNCMGLGSEWRELDNPDFNDVVGMVKKGRIRTKPRNVRAYVFTDRDGNWMDPNEWFRNGGEDDFTSHPIQIDEEGWIESAFKSNHHQSGRL